MNADLFLVLCCLLKFFTVLPYTLGHPENTLLDKVFTACGRHTGIQVSAHVIEKQIG